MGQGDEGLHYKGIGVVVDTGCAQSPYCLTCRLPLCWHDMAPGQRRAWLRSRREETSPAAPPPSGGTYGLPGMG